METVWGSSEKKILIADEAVYILLAVCSDMMKTPERTFGFSKQSRKERIYSGPDPELTKKQALWEVGKPWPFKTRIEIARELYQSVRKEYRDYLFFKANQSYKPNKKAVFAIAWNRKFPEFDSRIAKSEANLIYKLFYRLFGRNGKKKTAAMRRGKSKTQTPDPLPQEIQPPSATVQRPIPPQKVESLPTQGDLFF